MTATASCIVDCKNVLGEGPIWVEREQALYWVDIRGRALFRRSSEGEVERWETPVRLGCIAPRQGGGFICGTDQGLMLADPERAIYEPLVNPEEDRPANRFNDGKVDRSGRFWAGTMDDSEAQASGALYRVDRDGGWARIADDYRVTNGPAFSLDGRTMYHNDSARQVTYAFDISASGEASNRRLFARFGEGEGYPDGMTVDAEDCLWVAFWDGWCLRRFAHDGSCIATLEVPVQKPTSCAFGGPDLDLLFITSARRDLEGADLEKQPQAGGLFVAKPGVSGVAELPFGG